jgi:transposase-like protein
MEQKNKYANRSKISEAKFREIVRLFSADLDAGQIAEIAHLNRNTVNRYLGAIRIRIAEYCETTSPIQGEIEVDESYFGAHRVKGKRGRGARGKTIVFGLYKRQGKVYTEIVPDCSRATLQAIIRGKVKPDSVIHSDGWRGYNGLVDVGYEKHLRVDHGSNEFVRGNSHINGIEGFWGFSKSRLTRFKGLPKSTFYLHLKECEFRFNFKDADVYHLLLNIIRKNPLF